MAKSRIGDRLTWKDRLNQKPWIDSSPWMEGESREGGGEGVEFLEAEPSAYRLSQSERDRAGPGGPSPLTRIVGFSGVAVVLIALAIMSRPGVQDPFEQLPADKQQEIRQRQIGPDGVPPTGENPADPQPQPVPIPQQSQDGPAGLSADDGGPRVLTPIPALRSDLSAEMSGVLLSYGSDASVVQIRRSDGQPIEFPVGFAGVDNPARSMRSSSSLTVASDGQLLVVSVNGEVARVPVTADVLLPADADGLLAVTEEGLSRRAVRVGRPEPGQEVSIGQPWTVDHDVELLGSWRDGLVVAKAGGVWLIDRDGGSTAISDGLVITFDGERLAMVRCSTPADCRIEVGPPDQPAERSVPVPGRLLGRDPALWASAGAISADGGRLALIDMRVPVSLPMWIDMATGEAVAESVNVNDDSPIAWSPDGRWLAYAFGDDIMVWDTAANISWRLFIDRIIGSLAWVVDPQAP